MPVRAFCAVTEVRGIFGPWWASHRGKAPEERCSENDGCAGTSTPSFTCLEVV